jgi:hypothetical protein
MVRHALVFNKKHQSQGTRRARVENVRRRSARRRRDDEPLLRNEKQEMAENKIADEKGVRAKILGKASAIDHLSLARSASRALARFEFSHQAFPTDVKVEAVPCQSIRHNCSTGSVPKHNSFY